MPRRKKEKGPAAPVVEAAAEAAPAKGKAGRYPTELREKFKSLMESGRKQGVPWKEIYVTLQQAGYRGSEGGMGQMWLGMQRKGKKPATGAAKALKRAAKVQANPATGLEGLAGALEATIRRIVQEEVEGAVRKTLGRIAG